MTFTNLSRRLFQYLRPLAGSRTPWLTVGGAAQEEKGLKLDNGPLYRPRQSMNMTGVKR